MALIVGKENALQNCAQIVEIFYGIVDVTSDIGNATIVTWRTISVDINCNSVIYVGFVQFVRTVEMS